jgi:hypothetical protein
VCLVTAGSKLLQETCGGLTLRIRELAKKLVIRRHRLCYRLTCLTDVYSK